jgi:hypothetical protein
MVGEARLGLGSAGPARGVGPGRRPERNHKSGTKFVDCVRIKHLRRDFQAMIDRGGGAEPVGKKLLRLSDRLFRWWHRLEAEKIDWGDSIARCPAEARSQGGPGGRCAV